MANQKQIQQASLFLQLRRQGLPPDQAFKQAFPEGLPNSAENLEKEAKRQAKEDQNAGLAQTGGTLAGAVGTKYLVDAIGSAGKANSVATPTGVTVTPVGQAKMPDGSTGTLMNDGSKVGSGGQVVTPDGVTVTNGKALDSSGSILTGDNASKAIGYASSIYQAYNTYKNRDDLSTAQQAIGYGQAASTAYQTAYGSNPYLAAAGGAANIYGTYSDDNLTAEQQAARAQQQAGAAVIDYYIPGLGSALDAGLQSTSFGRKLTELDAKYNPMTMAIASFGSGKSGEQMKRDKVRKQLERLGVVNKDPNQKKDWMLNFSDGGSFDIGKDGGARLTNEAGERRQYSDVDFSDARAGEVVGAVNPLSAILTGGNDRLRSDFAGLYTNATLNNAADAATINKRVQELYTQHGLDQSKAISAIDDLQQRKSIDEATAAAYKNGINQVFAGTSYTGGSKSAAPQSSSPLGSALASSVTPQPSAAPVQSQIQPSALRAMPSAQQSAAMQGGGNMTASPQYQNLMAQISPTQGGQLMQALGIPAQPVRSQTLSPGIGKDGKRINYGGR